MNLLVQKFPDFGEAGLYAFLQAEAHVKNLHEHDDLLVPGHYVTYIPLVTEGLLQVLRQSPDGHELFLYYLHPGQTCAMALACCGAVHPSPLRINAAEPSSVVLLPVSALERLNGFKGWRNFIAANYAERFQELLEVLDGIAFQHMDTRLAQYLNTKAEHLKTNQLTQTHQEIATQLGTSREVISRLLKQMEKQNLIKLHRNRIEML